MSAGHPRLFNPGPSPAPPPAGVAFGVISASAFRKEIKDFFGAVTRVATLEDLRALGLNSQYVGWTLSTQFNSGAAHIEGIELSARQGLDGFTRWGKYFTIYGNWTRLLTNGDRDANFTSFRPTTINGGFSFSRSPVAFRVNWIHRGERRGVRQPTYGPDAYAWLQPQTQVDLNLGYQLSRRLTAFANILNSEVGSTKWGPAGAPGARSRMSQLRHARARAGEFRAGGARVARLGCADKCRNCDIGEHGSAAGGR